MLKIPERGYRYRMLCIDNGTNTMGVSVIDLDLRTGWMQVRFSETCTASRGAGRYEAISAIHGERFGRYRVLREFLLDVLGEWDPDEVVVEGPFMHIQADAFAKLRESLYLIRETVMEYYYLMDVDIVAPMSAKKAVKASSYVQGKDPVRQAVLALKNVGYDEGIDVNELDEHCIDSIAVACYKAEKIMKQVTRRTRL